MFPYASCGVYEVLESKPAPQTVAKAEQRFKTLIE
jgi:hypothetical protein